VRIVLRACVMKNHYPESIWLLWPAAGGLPQTDGPCEVPFPAAV